ncbi:MAG: YCF48-related protein [Pyrinomonadaceae bacterium]
MKLLGLTFFLVLPFIWPTSSSRASGQSTPVWKKTDLACFGKKSELLPVSAHFFNSESGWIVGSNGELLGNSRAVRIQIKSGTKKCLNVRSTPSQYSSVHFTSNLKGWIVGSEASSKNVPRGILIETTDGGITWKDKKLDMELRANGYGLSDFFSIYFSNLSNGYILGGTEDAEGKTRGIILTTRDGGSTWKLSFLGEEGVLFEDIKFCDDNRTGWVVTSHGFIFKTLDGGDSWQKQITKFEGHLSRIAILSQTEAWVTSRSSSLLHTKDGGETWNIVPIVLDRQLYESSTIWFTPIFFSSRRDGWIGGSSGLILRTKNSGQNWVVESFSKSDYVYDLSFTGKTGIAIARSGIFVRTDIE